MITRENSTWYVYWGWQLGACAVIALMVVYWVLIYPFVYHALLVRGLWQSKLTTPAGVRELVKWESKYTIGAVEGWLSECAEDDVLRYRVLPTWHWASKKIVVSQVGWGGSKVIALS